MRREGIFWMLSSLAVGVFLITLITTGRDHPEIFDQNTSRLHAVENKEGKIVQQQGAKVMDIDSIQLYNNVQKKLNTSPVITVIDHNGRDKSHFVEHQVVVDFKTSPEKNELDQISQEIQGKVLKKLDSSIIFSSNKMSTSELITYFEGRGNVEFAEPNYILMQNQPNDAFYPDYQWNLRMIDTEGGWNISRGAENVLIAVIDTGADLDHPDLAGRLVEGYNLLEGNNNANDDNGHGTHVTGIVASQTNNQEGIAGITWFNPIMPIKAMGSEGYGSSFDIAKGIIWATDHGADVINMSLGNYQDSKMLRRAVEYAYKKDVVMIAASGNDNTDQPSYPAAYPQVLSVAAVDNNGQKANFSNYGDYIGVTAPGVDIASTYFGDQYAALSGTSMATPHVAALAGLIRSVNPNLSNKEVINIIKRSATDLGLPGHDTLYGEGLIDISTALQLAAGE